MSDAERDGLLQMVDAALDRARETAREAERERIAWLAGTDPMGSLRQAVRDGDADAAMQVVGHLLLRSEATIAALQERATLAETRLASALGGRAA